VLPEEVLGMTQKTAQMNFANINFLLKNSFLFLFSLTKEPLAYLQLLFFLQKERNFDLYEEA
jgi:hypothetical protein